MCGLDNKFSHTTLLLLLGVPLVLLSTQLALAMA